ncbi:hypothetical protein [Hyalangium minutum]|uniref:Uncharacterized protein n=1 Tax=Hyalangium minutum TaxID=394096 RepID=A0A085WI53_9BACT|nr:hypothetical protein [Hyalangium minutum]KFE67279.1 hypothetical protein DB31_8632 [Hyalangium minutum]KFE67366.1 hypothetical protein DB31_8719 [Hyalangium minutum]
MFTLFKSKEATRAVPEAPFVHRAIPDDITLEQLGSELRQLFAQENSNHHRMGEIYNHIVEKKLAEAAGYKDSTEYFRKELADLSVASLKMYGAVAESFSEPVARRFGVTCLSVLLTYAEATGLELNHEEPGPTPIEVPDEHGNVAVQPFGACSVDQMRRALQRKRRPTSTKPLPPEKVALAEQYSAAVAQRFPKGKGTQLKVKLRNQKGKAVLDIQGIPLEQILQLVEALSAELPPVSTGEKAPVQPS